MALAAHFEDAQCPSVAIQPGHVGQLGADPTAQLPAKVISKIENLEFVEIVDLLQEAWAFDASDSYNQTLKQLGRQPLVSDILVWAECHSAMAAVLLSRKYPAKAPELFCICTADIPRSPNLRQPRMDHP